MDSDGDELPEIDERAEELRYRVWYSLSVIVEPPAPLGNLAMKCACQVHRLFVQLAVLFRKSEGHFVEHDRYSFVEEGFAGNRLE